MLPPTINKKLIISFLLLFMAFATARSQSFYIASSGIKRITLTKTGYTSQSLFGCASAASLALFGDKLYTTSGGTIIQAIITGNNISDCKTLASIPGSIVNGITVSRQGILYYASGFDLYRLDPKTPVAEFLGTMPYMVGGDFIFYNDVLYMSTDGGIVKVNIDSPASSELIIPIAGNVFGMASVLDFDGKIKVYALLTTSGTDMLELDLVNNLVVKTAYRLTEFVGDAASNVESGILSNTVTVAEQCDNPGKGQIQVSAISDKKPVYYSLNGGVADTVGLYQNLNAGTYNIKITAPDTSVTVTAVVPDYSLNRPAVTFNAINAKCEVMGQVQFQIADDAAKYLLKFNGDTLNFASPVTGLAPGKYQFTVLRSNGCLYGNYDVTIGRTKCDIIVNDVAVAQQCDALLRGVVTVNTPTHAYPYIYTLSEASNADGKFSNVEKGTYQIKITSSEDTIFVPVTVPDYKLLVPAFNVTQKPELCDLGGEITFDNLGNDRLAQILFNGTLYPFNHTFGKLHTDDYHFTFLDKNGCIVDTASVLLQRLPCSPVAFPNTFTPNGDGVNDIFRPNLDGYARQYKLYVYSRNGQEVFVSTDYFEGWPGTSRGKDAPAGVYYWLVNFLNDQQKPVTQKGWVTLLK